MMLLQGNEQDRMQFIYTKVKNTFKLCQLIEKGE